MSDQYYYPNVWGRSILTAAEEILGVKGVNALLNLAGLPNYIGNYPADNIKKEFPFEDVAAIQEALREMYGTKGARVFATKGGEQTFTHSLEKYDKVQKAAQAAMTVGTLRTRLKAGLLFFAKFFNTVSDQKVRIEEDETHWKWIIEICPMCHGKTASEPICHLAVGVLNAASSWASGGETLRIKAVDCIATGAREGVILLEKPTE
jgi:predicted hydrocarbon binding protein